MSSILSFLESKETNESYNSVMLEQWFPKGGPQTRGDL